MMCFDLDFIRAIVFCMSGHIARRLQRYMEFFHGVPSKIFNIGSYRRKLMGNYHPPSYFDHANKEALRQRAIST